MVLLEHARLTEDEREARWQQIADARLLLYGTDALLVPMGWKTHSSTDGTTVTTIGGQQVVFTASQSQSIYGFDIPPSYLGPLGIPVINFNQTDEWFETPDAAFWNDSASSSEPSYFWSFWINLVDQAVVSAIMTKTAVLSGSSASDWGLFVDSAESFACRVFDDSANAYIQVAEDGIAVGWRHLALTKTDDNAGGSPSELSSDFTLYLDGVAVGAAAEVGTYLAQEDGTEVVRIGAETDGSNPNGLSIAGGPLGPMFIAVGANTVPTADIILRDYQLGRAALGV